MFIHKNVLLRITVIFNEKFIWLVFLMTNSLTGDIKHTFKAFLFFQKYPIGQGEQPLNKQKQSANMQQTNKF